MTEPMLGEMLIYLGAAVLVVPLAKRFGLGAVIGYLTAGMLIGPRGLGWIADHEHTMRFAEFGVVLLMFLIGLELNPATLWRMRKPIFGLGLAQVVITSVVLAGLGWLAGWSVHAALIAGMTLSLSSTAIALQSMQEKNLLNTPGGRSAFAVLLLQDMAVIPMLALMPLLGVQAGHTLGHAWQAVLLGAGAIALIIVGGHYLLRPLFRIIASVGLREVLTAFSLLIVIGSAVLMQSVGLSMALVTFLAGVLLADSEYRHQLEADVEPFKGLLLGLFFISVGMSIDLRLLTHHPAQVLVMVAVLILAKAVVLAWLGRRRGLDLKQTALFTLFLAQGGEFAFVLLHEASGVLGENAGLLTLVVALSMLLSPLLVVAYLRWLEPRLSLRAALAPQEEVPETQHPVIIAGFGRFGQIVARLLHANGVHPTVIDHSPEHIERVRRFGFKIYYGDATRLDLLEAAGAGHAKLLVLAMDNREQINQTVQIAREHFPHLTVMARAWDMIHAYELLDRGVSLFQRETFDAALNLGEQALRELGMSAYQAKVSAQKFKHYDEETLRRMYTVHHDEEKLISASQEAREELEKLFQADQKVRQLRDNSWGDMPPSS